MDDDLAFFNVVQGFAEKQVNLESDFAESLDELLKSQIGSKPYNKRF